MKKPIVAKNDEESDEESDDDEEEEEKSLKLTNSQVNMLFSSLNCYNY